jgi:hypothetical protein
MAGFCVEPDCGGLNELSETPRSQRLIATLYTGSKIAVLDSHGLVLAAFPLPPIADPCNPGTTLTVAPRTVVTNPASELGDERFVVAYDTSLELGQPLQEFSWDEPSRTLTAITAAFLPSAPSHPGPICGTPTQLVTQPIYDRGGNLWIGTGRGLGNAPLHVFRASADGSRPLEGRCSYLDDFGEPRPFGTLCRSDLDLGPPSRSSLPNWGTPWGFGLVEDRRSGAVFEVTARGEVVALRSHGPSLYSAQRIVDLGINLLPLSAGESHLAVRGAVDSLRRKLWIPVATLEHVGPCAFFDCDFEGGVSRDAWLYRIDIDRALSQTVRIAGVTAPQRTLAGHDVQIELQARLGSAMDTGVSKLLVYLDDSNRPQPRLDWQVGACERTCSYSAVIPGSSTQGSEKLTWRAILIDDLDRRFQLAGWIELEAPQCQDGLNNDPAQDDLIDFDGGQSIWGECSGGTCPPGVSDPDGDGIADPDPHCNDAWRNVESGRRCGSGFELVLLLPLLMGLRRRRLG